MNVEVILKTKGSDVTTITSSDTLANAVKLLCDNKIGAVVVVDDGRVRGILSERDLI